MRWCKYHLLQYNFQRELKNAQSVGLFQKGPILDFLHKTCPSLASISSHNFTPCHGQLLDPRHRIKEILQQIMHKSDEFEKVHIRGKNEKLDVSKIHPLDIIMFIIGWYSKHFGG